MGILDKLIKAGLKSSGVSRVTPGLRRMTVSGVIKSFDPKIFQTHSANSILNAFKAQNLGVNRQWFLRQFRSAGIAEKVFPVRKPPSSGYRLRAGDLKEAGVNISSKYSYQLIMTVQGFTSTSPTEIRDIDEFGTQVYFFGSETFLSPSQAVKAFKAKFKDGSMASVRAIWDTLQFTGATKRGPII